VLDWHLLPPPSPQARRLKKHIDSVRKHYERLLQSEDEYERQSGTAMWIIDRLALRVGGEKDEDEADTVGCCSLRREHLSFPSDHEVRAAAAAAASACCCRAWTRASCAVLLCAGGCSGGERDSHSRTNPGFDFKLHLRSPPPGAPTSFLPLPVYHSLLPLGSHPSALASSPQVTLDFLGKDSMRYHQTIELERWGHTGKLVLRNLQRFTAKKKKDEDVFDYLTVRAGTDGQTGGQIERPSPASNCSLSLSPVSHSPASQPSRLNEQLDELMPGLSAKVFRTYNASITLERELEDLSMDTPGAEKVRADRQTRVQPEAAAERP